MRYLAKCVQLGMIILLFSTVAQAQPPGGGGGGVLEAPVAQAMLAGDVIGINVDYEDFGETICGFVILWQHPTPPISFYDGDRNPWDDPLMVPLGPPGMPVMWLLVFGGANGPCFSKSDPIFYENGNVNGEFLGLHFGFYTDVKIGQFVTFPCWWIGANGQLNPCSGITSYHYVNGFLSVANANAEDLLVQNAAVAFSPSPIAINDLNRINLPDLEWRPLSLRSNRLPAAEGDRLGMLTLEIPAELRRQDGIAIFAYDIADPETREVLSSVTFEVAIPKEE